MFLIKPVRELIFTDEQWMHFDFQIKIFLFYNFILLFIDVE